MCNRRVLAACSYCMVVHMTVKYFINNRGADKAGEGIESEYAGHESERRPCIA